MDGPILSLSTLQQLLSCIGIFLLKSVSSVHPWDTRKEWVDIICGRVTSTTLESLPVTQWVTMEGDLRDQVAKLKNDAWDLLYQVIDEKVKVIKRD
ncbi:hypothetical protein IGI04_008583 [Brassica rapa subsp. trilocularis]|uniref:Rx N-terminal domain-containing protein n=1 Tax=Brassica rapa subsp. trilocularis TaxID=1813537 RepID=A0ABQ7NN19_BRACM|nr:hypothetical protein IGI04_008583 [Brassica rapa subsp. trilocularis]